MATLYDDTYSSSEEDDELDISNADSTVLICYPKAQSSAGPEPQILFPDVVDTRRWL